MSKLFDMLMNLIYSLAGYITKYFGWLYNALYTFLAYIVSTIISWIFYSLSWLIILTVYLLDSFLGLLVYILNRVFGGDIFGLVGLSVSAIEDNLDVILAVAPYAKMTAYVLNLDAASDAFHVFLVFLVAWTAYRWFRVWVRG